MWINPATQTVYRTREAIRAAYPGTSFPEPMGASSIAYVGLLPVLEVTPPAYSPLTHTLQELAPVLDQGVWTQQWLLTALSTQDAAAELARARRQRWKEVKDLRDDKIQNGGIFTNSQWYPSNAAAKAEMLWVKAIGSNTGQRIELLDGSMANLTFNRVNDLLTAGAAQAAAISAYADSLKVLIDAAQDPSTVDINAGWPAVYAG